MSQYIISFSTDHRYIFDLVDRHGFYYLDLLPVYQEYSKQYDDAFVRDPLHPSALGHSIAGDAIGRYIETKILRSE